MGDMTGTAWLVMKLTQPYVVEMRRFDNTDCSFRKRTHTFHSIPFLRPVYSKTKSNISEWKLKGSCFSGVGEPWSLCAWLGGCDFVEGLGNWETRRRDFPGNGD